MSEPLKPCKDLKEELIQKVLDYQADLQITISHPDELAKKTVPQLQDLVTFYEDGLKNGRI